MTVLWWTKSVTDTESVMSWVRVPLHLSAIVHLVPRTVAALYLPVVRNLPWALAWRSWRVLLESAAIVASPAFLALQVAYVGAPLNALSTRARLTSPLFAPRVAWVSLKIAPPKLPVCVLIFFFPLAAASCAGLDPPGRAVVSLIVPWSASITVLVGICVSSVRGTNTPWIFTSTSPLTTDTLNVLPSVGGLGAGAA